jgi:hypothetical protein
MKSTYQEEIMRRKDRLGVVVLTLLACVALVAAGCGKDEGPGNQGKGKGGQGEQQAKNKEGDKKAQDHSGWWCEEHGIPEHLCKMCDEKLKTAADVTCEHDLVKSQCFRCNPQKREHYARMYRAKYEGKDPPPAIEQGDKAKGEKGANKS